MENFIGKDGYVWWMGVVENRIDPLNLHRCQVRIFGWHSDNKEEIPTEDLPWAICSVSPNTADSFSTPKEGSYVKGYFADGLSGQVPILDGFLPGLKAGPNGDKGFQDPRTDAEIASAPQLPEGHIQETVGEPTTAPLARGIVANTAIEIQNTTRDFVKDISTMVKAEISSVKAEALLLIAEARAIKDEIVASLIGSPDGQGIANEIEQAKKQAKAIQDKIAAAQQAVKDVQAAIAEVMATVAYIEGLPAEAIALVNKEVNGLYSDILSSATSDITSLKSKLPV